MSTFKDINEYYTKLSYDAVAQIPFCVCPIHYINQNVPLHHSSGILIKIKDSHFLATASHSLEDLYSFYIPVPPDLHCQIEGESFRTMGANEIYVNDKIDISVIKLRDRTVEILNKHYKFLDGTRIAINHTLSEELAYIIIGFPKGKTERNTIKKITKCDPFSYHTIAYGQNKYSDLGYDSRFNILVEYDMKNIISNRTIAKKQGPHPRGMSGGALFHIPMQTVDIEKESITFYLVGILNYHNQIHKAIAATRIDFITEIIRIKFGLDIPRSTIINLNTSVDGHL